MRNAKTLPPGYKLRKIMGVYCFETADRISRSYNTKEAARVAVWNDLFQKANEAVKAMA